MSIVKVLPFWKFPSSSSGKVVVAIIMVIVINSVIGKFSWVDSVWLEAPTVQLPVSDYSQQSDYNWMDLLVKIKAANAPITFEEIVMVRINR